MFRLSPIQCKMARAATSWGVRDLARQAKISPDTVARFERGERLRERTIRAMRNAFEAFGIEFIPNGVVVRAGGRSIDPTLICDPAPINTQKDKTYTPE